MRKGSPSAFRRLVVLPVAFALAMALVMPTAAFAAEPGTSNYGSKPPTPTTPTSSTPAPTPTTGTSPSKESSTPTKTTAPETTKSEPSEPTATTAAKKATTLPFTGFDLRWVIVAGLLLMGTGFSLVVMQRRQRRSDSR